MINLQLVKPDESYRDDWLAYLCEWNATGVKMTPYSFDPHQGDFDLFLAEARRSETGIDLPAGKVRAGFFFLVGDTSPRILGAVSIRYELNDYLRRYGGNIGYGVRVSERRQGYAKAMLALACDHCRRLGMEKVLVTCDTANTGSARTIQANGGILENEVIHDDGTPLQRYWIPL